MIGHFPACTACGSLDVMYASTNGADHTYHCYFCGHDTPTRDTRTAADADMQWTPATVGTPNVPLEAA